MGLELLFLLLPFAALSGWWIGRRQKQGNNEYEQPEFSTEYFTGLNYLLNEQQDKAIEVFIRMLDVDSDTVETHLTLAKLFRKRGEVERSIRIHQNLIARPTLVRKQRDEALFELGRDYMAAGLLDRAESLFSQLVSGPDYAKMALEQLLDIFQQEKDWEHAIQIARRLTQVFGVNKSEIIAHFYCEQAEICCAEGNVSQAKKLLKKAIADDRNSVRATLLEARFEIEAGSYKSAIRILKRVEQQSPEFLSEIIEPLEICYQTLGKLPEMKTYLMHLQLAHGHVSTIMALSNLIAKQQSEDEAVLYITDYLQKTPSIKGLNTLIEFKLNQSVGVEHESFHQLKQLTASLLLDKPAYECSHCGFSGQTMHWQCPGCKQWGSVKPI